MCVFSYAHMTFYTCDLDLDLDPVIYELELWRCACNLHTKNEVTRSWLSNARARTADRRDQTHYHDALAVVIASTFVKRRSALNWSRESKTAMIAKSKCVIMTTKPGCLVGWTNTSPIPLRLYTSPYWSNPPYVIFDIQALWHSALSARAPECQKIANGWLDQYGAEPFEQQQFGTVGVERVNVQRALEVD